MNLIVYSAPTFLAEDVGVHTVVNGYGDARRAAIEIPMRPSSLALATPAMSTIGRHAADINQTYALTSGDQPMKSRPEVGV